MYGSKKFRTPTNFSITYAVTLIKTKEGKNNKGDLIS